MQYNEERRIIYEVCKGRKSSSSRFNKKENLLGFDLTGKTINILGLNLRKRQSSVTRFAREDNLIGLNLWRNTISLDSIYEERQSSVYMILEESLSSCTHVTIT